MSDGTSMAAMVEANPNFELQMRDWQSQRQQKGEDPLDWQAFRDLETYIGAPDPGDQPPPEFSQFSATATAAFGAGAADAFSGGPADNPISTTTAPADSTDPRTADVASSGTAPSAPAEQAATSTPTAPNPEGKTWAERWGTQA